MKSSRSFSSPLFQPLEHSDGGEGCIVHVLPDALAAVAWVLETGLRKVFGGVSGGLVLRHSTYVEYIVGRLFKGCIFENTLGAYRILKPASSAGTANARARGLAV